MSHILLHTLVFAPDSVSTAFLMTDLARQLHASGHDVTVLTTTPHYNLDPAALARQPLQRRLFGLAAQSSCDGVRVWHVRLPMKGERVYTRVLDYIYFHIMSLAIGLLLVRRYDIVITPSPPLTIGVVGWLLGTLRGAPSVYDVQEVYPDFAVNQGLIRNRLLIAVLKRLERFVYARSTHVVTISDWFTRIVRARGVPAGKVSTIPNFVDTALYQPLPRANRFAEQHGLRGSFVVLYGGNVGLSQDWDSFLHAAEVLRERPILFVVVGDGVRTKWLEQQISSRALTNVRLLGYQSRLLMPEINACADLCTIPMKTGTTSDTFPSKIYTIMACGKSVLVQADPDSELHWLVSSHGCGRVVPPDVPDAYAEAVLKAFLERELLPAEGEKGRVLVQDVYSKETVAARYHALITDLVHHK
jgi:colanic acid biosynthesis glycosyl transferase WcaI